MDCSVSAHFRCHDFGQKLAITPLKLAVSVRMGYTYPYGSGVRTQTSQCLSHGGAPCDSCLVDLVSYALTTYTILIGSRDQLIINKNLLSTHLE